VTNRSCTRLETRDFVFQELGFQNGLSILVIFICLAGLVHKHPFGFKSIVSINGDKMKTELQAKWFYFEFPVLTDHILLVEDR